MRVPFLFLEWDHRGRLTRIFSYDGGTWTKTIEYTYDALDRRVAKASYNGTPYFGAIPTEFERFVVDGDSVLAVMDEAGDTRERFLIGPQIDQVLAQENLPGYNDQDLEIDWFLSDHLNTVRDIARIDDSSDAHIVNHIVYSAFGQEISETGTTNHRFGYTSRDRDPESGLYYYRARYYDAVTGRFIGQDPIEFAAGDVNLYRYVGNGATDASDPSGLYEEDFHCYAVYYLHVARGWSANDAERVAGWSQFVDDNPKTEPLFATAGTRRDFHFAGSSASDDLTVRDEPGARNALIEAYRRYESEGMLYNECRVGAALHTYADTWSHEGFTACVGPVNVRTGSLRPNIGHADAPQGGHGPDLPYNDIDKAIEAAREIYTKIPIHTDGPIIPWETVERILRSSFRKPAVTNALNSYGKDTRKSNIERNISDSPNVTLRPYLKERFERAKNYFNYSVGCK